MTLRATPQHRAELPVIDIPMTKAEANAVMRVIGRGCDHTEDEGDRAAASAVAKRIVRILLNESNAPDVRSAGRRRSKSRLPVGPGERDPGPFGWRRRTGPKSGCPSMGRLS